MAKVYVTNNHSIGLDFPTASGEPKHIEAGATEYFEPADPNNVQFRAWQHVSLITVSDKDPSKAADASKPTAPTIAPTDAVLATAPATPPASAKGSSDKA